MDDILAELTKYPVKTRLSLTGPLVVARDIAHAKIKERLDAGEGMPQYLKDHPVYYAGPAKTPEGYASGSFGPTTPGAWTRTWSSSRHAGGSKVMLAKGNGRSRSPTRVTRTAGSTWGPSAGRRPGSRRDCIKKVEVVEYEELGMEAVWRIEVWRTSPRSSSSTTRGMTSSRILSPQQADVHVDSGAGARTGRSSAGRGGGARKPRPTRPFPFPTLRGRWSGSPPSA
ncbi:hypothetical protein GCM10023238_05310 [Streptomyces heliomycini]